MNDICFGLDRNYECGILTVRACAGGACPFRKTAEDLKASCDIANKRLAVLPEAQQLKIADKYFDGRMPWLEGGAGHDR